MSDQDRWLHEIANQDEGEAHLIYRAPRTAESLRELEEWLELIIKKLHRWVESAQDKP